MTRRLLLVLAISHLGIALSFESQAANCSSNPFTLTNGQTADATQVMSNFNNLLNCANNNLAHNGANSDITALTGLTTPLPASEGGSGLAAPTVNDVLLGNGASAFQVVAPQTSGLVLVSNGSTWISGSGGRTLMQTVTANNASSIVFNTGIDTAHKAYTIRCSQIVPLSNAFLFLRVSLDGGATFKSGVADYTWSANTISVGSGVASINSSAGDAQILLTATMTGGNALNGNIDFFAPAAGGQNHIFQSRMSGTGPLLIDTSAAGAYVGTANALNSIAIVANAGNISGTCSLYGDAL